MESDADSDRGSGGDCSESDARLGLCGVFVPAPQQQELHDKEAQISEELEEREKKGDLERKSIMMEINKQRLLKAKKLMKDLVETDKRISDLVHHAVKVSSSLTYAPPRSLCVGKLGLVGLVGWSSRGCGLGQ